MSMSNQVTTWLWEHSAAHGMELLVLLAIGEHADKAGIAWPSIKRLAQRCRMDRRSVQRAVGRLVEKGLLAVVEEGGGAGKSNRYRVVMERAAQEPLFEAEERAVPAPPLSPERAALVHEKGGTSAAGTVIEPTTPPTPRQARGASTGDSGGGCAAHPDKPGTNCRACGTSPRARAKAARLALVPDWCGTCDTPETRMVEAEDGRVARCPICHPAKVAAS